MGKIKAIWKKVKKFGKKRKENFPENLVNSLGWIFCTCAVAIVSWNIYPFLFGESLESGKSLDFSRVFMAGVRVATAGVLAAVGAQFFAQGKRLTEQKEQDSRYYLDSCVAAYEEALKILKDGTNKRVDWA